MGGLAGLVLCAWVTAAPWPSEGFVDLDGLARRGPGWQQVQALRAQARALRAASALLPPVVVGPVAPDRVPPTPQMEQDATRVETQMFAPQALSLEIQVLREAYLSQIGADRRRGLSAQATRLAAELLRAIREEQLRRSDWELALVRSQQLERLNVALHLREADVAAKPRYLALRDALDALGEAVAEQWRREQAPLVTRRLRTRLEEVGAQLSRDAAQQQSEADRVLVEREVELAEAARLFRAAQEAGRVRRPELDVDLALAAWHATMAQRGQRLAAARAQGQSVDAERAAALEAEADRLERGLAADSRKRAAAWVALVARRERVRLVTAAAPGLADLTARVADAVAALEADPRALAPDPPADLTFADGAPAPPDKESRQP